MTCLRTLALCLVIAAPAVGQAAPAAAPAAAAPAEIDASKLNKLPKQKSQVAAEYPPDALAKEIETDVTLLLDVDAQGNVSGVALLKPSDQPGYGFDEAATAAATQFEFEPAEMDGKPIAVQIPYVYKFRLPKAPPPAAASPVAASAPAAAPPPPPKPAPVVNFAGRLLERGTRTPMVGLLVTIFHDTPAGPTGFDASTDTDGRFKFFDLAIGEWKVLVEAPGYYPYRTTEEVRPGEATVVTYYVERGSYNPFDVTTTAARPRKEVNRVVLPSSVIDKIPGTGGDPLAVLQNLPGVARTPLFSGQVVVRGSAPEDSQIFIDGTIVPNIYHFGGLRSVVPIGILESIEFLPGNFSSFYGRATGGIIDVQIKQLKPARVGGYADISLLDTSLYLEVPVSSKAAIAFGGRRSYLDAILNATVPDDAPVNLVTAPVYYDYQLVANYRPSPAHDLRAFVFGSDDRLAILFTKPGALANAVTSNRFDTHQSFQRGIFEYRYVPSDRVENSLRLSAGPDLADFNLGNLTFKLETTVAQLRDTFRWKLTDWLTPVVGVDALYQKFNGLVRLPLPPKEGEPMNTFDPTQIIESRIDASYWSPAGFIEFEIKPLPKLFLSAGLRADYFQRIHQTTLAPRLVGRYDVLPALTLKGGVGLFYQEPFFDETDGGFGNPDLKAERAVHTSAGLEWKPRPFITIDGTFFYKDLSNLASPTRAVVVDNGVERPLRYDNGGTGRVMGFELLAKHDFTARFAGWLAYTLSRAERRDSGATSYRRFDYDQTHILAALLSYQLPRNWLIGTRFRLVSGNPRTPIVGAIYNSNADRFDATFGAPNTDRDPLFHQLDLRIDKKWIYQRWTMSLYLDLQNVYNSTNPQGLSYNYDFTKSKPTQGLPVLTILGLKAEF